MTEAVDFAIREEDAGGRLDTTMARLLPDLSRNLAQRLIEEGKVTVNELPVRSSYRLVTGDRVHVGMWLPTSLSAAPEPISLEIVYQDQDVAVIDKPPGLVVHPSPGHESGTLANALTSMFPQVGQVGQKERPGIVHRLDKDTSGLMVVALSPVAQRALQRQIASRSMERRYYALVRGTMQPSEATIQAPIGRHRIDRKRMAAYGLAARPAQTSYKTVEHLPGFTLLEARLHTGRTHQIRVHMAAVAHPIAGDSLYGGPALEGLERQFLHAHSLSFGLPSTGSIVSFSSKLPNDLQAVLDALRQEQVDEKCR